MYELVGFFFLSFFLVYPKFLFNSFIYPFGLIFFFAYISGWVLSMWGWGECRTHGHPLTELEVDILLNLKKNLYQFVMIILTVEQMSNTQSRNAYLIFPLLSGVAKTINEVFKNSKQFLSIFFAFHFKYLKFWKFHKRKK